MTMDEMRLRAIVEQAFKAGCEQGSDEATAYEWGSVPAQNRAAALNDLFEHWNTGPILDALVEIRDAQKEAWNMVEGEG